MDFKSIHTSKPVLFCFRCLTFDPVRWNAQMSSSDEVEVLKPYVDFIINCPEYEIGLGAPRQTIRIVQVDGKERLLQHETGNDVTDKMNKYIEEHLPKYQNCDGFILKSKSPTSSIQNIPLYKTLDGPDKLGKTKGFFGRAILQKYGDKPIVEENLLKNPVLFEYFLTKVYLWASFRKTKQKKTMHALVEFQTRNKLLFMALNQNLTRTLGRIVGNQADLSVDDVFASYDQKFREIVQERLTYKNNINVLQHAMGYFKNVITDGEKQFFLRELDAYRVGTISLSVPIHIMRDWIIRYKEDYLGKQTYFWPFPDDIIAKSQFYSNKEKKERRSLIS